MVLSGEDILSDRLVEFPVDMVLLVRRAASRRRTPPGWRTSSASRATRTAGSARWTTTPTPPAPSAAASTSPASARARRTSPTRWPRPRPWRPASCAASSAAPRRGQPGQPASLGRDRVPGRRRLRERPEAEEIAWPIRANPRLVDELEQLRRAGRAQVLPLRQLQRGLPVLPGAVPLPAKVDALPPDGPGGQAARQPRAVALLLLRRVLRAVPARGRARRDDDEHAPLADRAVRLHRDLAALLPVVEGRALRHPAGGPPDRPRLLRSTASTLRQPRRRTTAPGAFLPSSVVHCFDWVHGGRARWRCSWSTARACGGSPSGATGRCASRSARYVRKAWLLPVHFLTQKRYRECDRKRPWADPPRADAQLRDDARPDHVLPPRRAERPRRSTGACHVFGYARHGRAPRHRRLRHPRPAAEGRDALPALARDRLDVPASCSSTWR